MLDELLDQAWRCFNKMDKKPPDRNLDSTSIVAETLKRRSSMTSPIILDPSVLPDRQRLESEFKQFLEELDLNPQKERELCSQSAEKKWLMIVEQQIRQDKSRAAAVNLETVIRRLQEWSRFFPDKYTLPLAIQQLEALAIALRTESISYVQQFIDLDGITLLTRVLAETRNGADCLALPILTCFKALLNSSTARKFVLDRSDTLLSVVGAIDSRNLKCQVGSRNKLLALEILGGLCLVPEGGHYAVLKALTDATTILGERTRFQKLVDELHKEHGSARDTERVRVALMSLFNALLKAGPAEQSLEFRLHLRHELLMLGVAEVIDGIRDSHGRVLEDHLDFFEMMRKDDEEELCSVSSSSANSSTLSESLETTTGLAEAVNRKLNKSVAQKHFLSILEHLLILSIDENSLHLWKLYDLILQELSLQMCMQDVKNVGEEVDAALAGHTLGVDMSRIMAKLRSEEECQRLERECIEKDKKIMELENRLSDLQDGFSLSSFSRGSDLGSSSPSEPCHSPTPSSTSSVPVIKAPVPPPPPPPTANQLRSLGGPILNPTMPKKKVPKPMGQLKSLNWTTIPHMKIASTIWENIGDEKLYDKLNLQDISVTFASGKDPADPSTLQRRIVRTETVPSVVEFRRGQNCTIMLSKLKLSHSEIKNAVLTMDEKNKLPRDMIEQMLKFIPTKDELAALDETLVKYKSLSVLPLADRFLFEVGQIPRYEQRLKCLNIIRSFQERVDGLKPFMNSVIKASMSLSDSNRVKQLLALLLAIGNYLNYGKRNGNAMGFTIRSLNTVCDVKSALKADRNLLHYIVELIEHQFSDLIKLKKEFNLLCDATKFSRAETEQELQDIQAALRYVSGQYNEHLQQQKHKSADERGHADEMGNDSGVEIGVLPRTDLKSPNKKSDKFLPTVKTFLNMASKQMTELEELNAEMKSRFVKCAAYFCEDATNSSPDDFFRVFTKFLSQFADCHVTVLKEREEREKRQTISKTMLMRRYGKKQRDSGPQMFDLLVNELTKGELFREDLSRLSQKYPWKKKQIAPASLHINA